MRTSILFIPAMLAAGCISTPPMDNPLLVHREPVQMENPVLMVAPGQPSATAYADVFEKVLNILEDYFAIDYANRYDGRIVCAPKPAPGILQFWKLGSPDRYERLLASFQSMRHRCVVQIREAQDGGYRVHVTVYRELEDLPRPTVSPNISVFRDAASVDRVYQILDANTPPDGFWIPKGRDFALEDEILKKLRRCQFD